MKCQRSNEARCSCEYVREDVRVHEIAYNHLRVHATRRASPNDQATSDRHDTAWPPTKVTTTVLHSSRAYSRYPSVMHATTARWIIDGLTVLALRACTVQFPCYNTLVVTLLKVTSACLMNCTKNAIQANGGEEEQWKERA